MAKARLDIPFKGARTYLHGTDLFNHALAVITAHENAVIDAYDIAFHRMVEKQVSMVIGTLEEGIDPFAVGSYVTQGQKMRFFLSEQETAPSGRLPFPEEELVARVAFCENDSSAKLVWIPKYSDIETWVPMIKALNHRCFPEAEGLWLFARARIGAHAPLKNADHVVHEVRLTAKLGTKLTRNEVFRDGHKMGDVFFALI